MIVVGYTPDKFGAAALEHAIAEAKFRNTGVKVVNTSTGDSLADPRFADSEAMTQLHATLDRSGVEYVLDQAVVPDTVDALLTVMDGDDADVLVIGIRHRSAVGKLLMGSSAQQLLLSCPKPVLAVKPPR